MSNTVIDYHPVKRPLGERINFRMLTVVAVFSLLVGWPVYKMVKGELNHGVEKVGDLYQVDLKSLGNFPFNDMTGTLDNVPPHYRDLDGKRVALEGFMVPQNEAGDKVNAFQFVYNVQRCCFNGPPQVQERVFGSVPHGGTVDLYPQNEEIRVFGVLHVKPDKNPAGKVETLYTMDVERAEPL